MVIKSRHKSILLVFFLLLQFGQVQRFYAQVDSFLIYEAEIKKATKDSTISELQLKEAKYCGRRGAFEKGRKAAESSLQTAINSKDSILQGKAYLSLASFDEGKQQYDKALEEFIKAEKLLANNRKLLSNVLVLKGELFYYNKDSVHARAILKLGLKMAEEEKDTFAAFVGSGDLGNVYFEQNKLDSALYWYFRSLVYFKGLKDSTFYEKECMNIGNVYVTEGKNEKGEEYIQKALGVAERFNDKVDLPVLYYNLGGVEFDLKHFEKAKKLLTQSASTGLKLNNLYNLVYCLRLSSRVDSALGRKDSSLLDLRKLIVLTNSLHGADLYKRMAEMQTKFDVKKKNDEIFLKNKDKQLADVKLKREQIMIGLVSGGLLLLFSLSLILYRNFIAKKRANLLLEVQKDVIEGKRQQLELKNEQIRESIQYAQRIQDTILPGSMFNTDEVKDHFVLFLPKDVVSGDFYWRYRSGDYLFFAVVDCTGHGVPGAMMSLLAFDMFEYAMNDLGLREPASILRAVNSLIIEKLHKSNPDGAKDGMDLSLCRLDLKTRMLCYAGARNDLLLISTGEVKVLSVDKQSIGYNLTANYTQQEIQLHRDEVLYLTSDGYSDQKGGPEGKKFMQGRLKKLLLEVADLPCDAQKERLRDEMAKWQGSYQQRDDILLTGIVFN
jgi:serine phosphatase RsbU (regulator of sigma subunit)